MKRLALAALLAACTGRLDGNRSEDGALPPGADGGTIITRRDAGPPFDAGPPPPPGCGLASAAFCDDFEAGPSPITRAGELDPARWSVGRAMPQLPTSGDGAFWVSVTRPVEGCRADLDGQELLADRDTLVCDPQRAIGTRHVYAAVTAQNYGLHSYRIRQPFDFRDRTGTITFDADLSADALLGWMALVVSEDPTPAPSFAEWEYSTGPREGIELQFSSGGSCDGGSGTMLGVDVGDPLGPALAIRSFRSFEETVVRAIEGACVPTREGHLNRVEVRLSRERIEVLASEPSDDGRNFGSLRRVFLADLSLPFERGYVALNVHNHATTKYCGVADWVARFDNVAFDGPIIATRDYSAPNRLAPATHGLDGCADSGSCVWFGRGGCALECPDADKCSTPIDGAYLGYLIDQPAQIQFDGVDVSEATSALLALTAWYSAPPFAPSYALRYRWNGGAWHERPITSAEIASVSGLNQQGMVNHAFEVPLEEIWNGTNTLEIAAQNVGGGQPPGVVNIDLVLR